MKLIFRNICNILAPILVSGFAHASVPPASETSCPQVEGSWLCVQNAHVRNLDIHPGDQSLGRCEGHEYVNIVEGVDKHGREYDLKKTWYRRGSLLIGRSQKMTNTAADLASDHNKETCYPR